jgi:hypothetical protein
MATDPLMAGSTQVVRWETTRTGTGVLEYSFDGRNWNAISNINFSTNYYKWDVPDTFALARLRMRSGPVEALTDTFAISPQMDLNLGFECIDSFLLETATSCCNWVHATWSLYFKHPIRLPC